MKYTVGNWSLDSGFTESNTSVKNYAIPALSRADFARKSHKDGEIQLANTQASGFDTVPEIVRFGATRVANVYAGSDIAVVSQSATKGGLRLLVEVRDNFTATNSVSGAEHQIPIRAWMVVQVPQSNLVTASAVDHVVGRLLGSIHMDGTESTVFSDRFMSIARGDLDPSSIA